MEVNAVYMEGLTKIYEVRKIEPGLLGGIKSLGKRNIERKIALNNISLEIAKGEMVAFLGPNGAGKSTTIKILTGVLQRTTGVVRVLGIDPGIRQKELSTQIGCVFGQRSQLHMHLTAIDSLKLLGLMYNVDKNSLEERINSLSKDLEVDNILNVPVRTLSLGQRMRIELLAALLHEPQILFLDEPTIGLDIIAKKKILYIIKKWNTQKNLTVFFTSHDPNDVERLCERAIVIDRGNTVIDESIDILKTHYGSLKKIKVTMSKIQDIVEIDGVKKISQGYTHYLIVDTRKTTIVNVINDISKYSNIIDIIVSDTSMEDILTDIYNRK